MPLPPLLEQMCHVLDNCIKTYMYSKIVDILFIANRRLLKSQIKLLIHLFNWHTAWTEQNSPIHIYVYYNVKQDRHSHHLQLFKCSSYRISYRISIAKITVVKPQRLAGLRLTQMMVACAKLME